jgi:PhnB protein
MSVHELFPYLCVADADAAIAFYCNVFGGNEKLRLVEPGGRIGHAEVDLGAGVIMLCEEYPEYDIRRPDVAAGTSVSLHLHVDDADEIIARAVAAGATVLMPAKDQFYGERSGVIRDPFGHRWNIGHSIEIVSAEEMQRRYDATTEPC